MSGASVEGIRVGFGGTVALDDVSLVVPAGEVTAVVGGDGAGKSTLLRVLAGRVAPDRGAVRAAPAAAIGYQPATGGVWANLSVAENLEFVGRAYGMSARAVRARGDELLASAGLADARHRLGRELSGGMRQKLGFVLAILHEPTLVLLDEPSTGVDPVSRVELWRLISATATGDTAVLLATTYLDEAQRAVSVTALDRGRVIAAGSPEAIIAGVPGVISRVAGDAGILDEPSDAAEATGASHTLTASWRRGVERHAWSPTATAAGRPLTDPDLEDALIALTLARSDGEADGDPGAVDDAGPSGAQRRATRTPRAARGEIVAAGRGVTRRFGAHTAVDDVSLEVAAGEIVGLIGANGAGKTTFLRTLVGLDRVDDGEVELFGVAPDAASRRRLGFVPQGLGLYQTLTVRENVDFFARVYGTRAAELPSGLAAVAGRTVREIGLGRQRRLAFTLALSHNPELLVLDEPTSGVDPLSRARLWDIIHAQADAGRAVLVTTHYLQEAEQCTRLALMSQGRLRGRGSVADLTAGVEAVLVTAPQWQRAFSALSAAGLPTMLSGRSVRVAGTPLARVREALGPIAARVEQVPPTLEEAMVLREA